MTDFAGKWEGVVGGTNHGRVFIEIEQHRDIASGTVSINDVDQGTYRYSFRGQVVGSRLRMTLWPSPEDPDIELGDASAVVEIQGGKTLTGECPGTHIPARQSSCRPARVHHDADGGRS